MLQHLMKKDNIDLKENKEAYRGCLEGRKGRGNGIAILKLSKYNRNSF